MDASDGPRGQGAQSLRRAMALLRLVAEGQEHGVRLVDLATASGLSRPTIHRMLSVLCEEHVVEQDPETRRYRIGPELTLLGMARSNRIPIRGLAEPFLRQLSEKVDDTVFLTVRQGADSVGIERITGRYPIQVLATEVGVRRPLGVGVAGVAILATLPPEEATRLIRENQRRLAGHGFTLAAMGQRVERARTTGYAWAPVGLIPGTSAVSLAIRDRNGQALAAISVAAMANRLTKERLPEVLDALRETARRVESRRVELARARLHP